MDPTNTNSETGVVSDALLGAAFRRILSELDAFDIGMWPAYREGRAHKSGVPEEWIAYPCSIKAVRQIAEYHLRLLDSPNIVHEPTPAEPQ